MEFEQENEGIAYEAIIAQLQHENEELRVRVANALKSSPIDEAVNGVVLVIQRSDPMKLYIWACIAFMLVMAVARLIEVFIHE